MPTGTHPQTSDPAIAADAPGRVIPLHLHRRGRPLCCDHTAVSARPLLAWHEVRGFVVGGSYREVPTGRVGRYVGPAEVHALDQLAISTAVLVFRCAATGQMYSYSQLDAQRGVAYEEVDG